jgi:GGDEF domain-containing protein
LPAGPILGAGYVLAEGPWLKIPVSSLNFYLYAIYLVGILLAWRFHVSRVAGALTLFVLAHRAVEFFGGGHLPASGPGLTALEVVSFLVPLNLLLLACSTEKGFALASWGPKLILLFFESVFVAVICRPHPAPGAELFHGALLNRSWFAWTRVPQLSLLAIALVVAALVVRFTQTRHPVDASFTWSLVAFSIAIGGGGVGRVATGLLALACLILAVSVLENSYRIAYYDELTGVPGRRAFNEALLRLQSPYSIAVVDIDHFKSFNDTYGHETGDDVLRMVARKLAGVSGGGEAFRVGGEEFSILFRGKSASAVYEHLELLRAGIEIAEFRLRGSDRRAEPRGPERRRPVTKRKRGSGVARVHADDAKAIVLSVTVSMGLAEPKAQATRPQDVIVAADQALYRAKEGGRNRIEMADGSTKPARTQRRKKASANIA